MVLALSALAFAAACGSSKDDELFGGSSSVIATGGAPGAGGAISSGTGGAPAPTCADPALCPVGPGQLGCCTNDYKCGIRVGQSPSYECLSPDLGGVTTSGCPSSFILDERGEGCCRSTGTCGFMDKEYGLGCVDPAQLDRAPGKPCP